VAFICLGRHFWESYGPSICESQWCKYLPTFMEKFSDHFVSFLYSLYTRHILLSHWSSFVFLFYLFSTFLLQWLESEKQRLGHLRDRASETGRRKEYPLSQKLLFHCCFCCCYYCFYGLLIICHALCSSFWHHFDMFVNSPCYMSTHSCLLFLSYSVSIIYACYVLCSCFNY